MKVVKESKKKDDNVNKLEKNNKKEISGKTKRRKTIAKFPSTDSFSMKGSNEIVFDDSDIDDDFAPSPIMDSSHIGAGRKKDDVLMNRFKASRPAFYHLDRTFNDDILKFAGIVKPNRIQKKADKESFGLFDIEAERNTFKKVCILRYRENFFRAVGRLTQDLPPFPKWIYRDKEEDKLERVTFIVGGTEYQSFEDTIVHIPNSKLATCVIEHTGDPLIFFDRDPDCFNSVLNFYRTGRLHAPANACLSFFEEELEFWGINEEFMEPCCYSEYKAYKTACNTLKKFSESKDKGFCKHTLGKMTQDLRMRLYSATVIGDNTITSMWYSTICASCIVIAIMILFFGTSSYGRVDIVTNKYRPMQKNETMINYFGVTSIQDYLLLTELILSGYFMADIIIRLVLSPNRFIFFTDTINWVDIIATVSSFTSNLLYNKFFSGFNEAYVIILKIPRIFRLFKLTSNLKSGMYAFILTLGASVNELRLVFLIVIIFVCIFGVLIFVVELVNEDTVPSKFTSIYIGMWWAIVTMTTVGYGDFVPSTQGGYMVGCTCIMCGIIICQLPVPIFLKNFSIYYNQAYARMDHQTRVLTSSIDPEQIADTNEGKRDSKIRLNRSDLLKLKRFSVAI